MRLTEGLRATIGARLARHARRSTPLSGRRAAAVALALLGDDDGRACVLLTRRPLHLPRHPGQFALPGGRLEPDESPTEAALRELEEEVGLRLTSDSVLGILDDYPTRSGFVITPVVLWSSENVPLDPDPSEVMALFRIPLETLAGEDILHLDRIPELEQPVLSLGLLDGRVFAPTAAMLYQLREVALFGRDTRVAHYESPKFAWR